MVFGKLFGSGKQSPAPRDDADAVEGVDDAEVEPEGAPEESGEIDWRARAAQVIPSGASTGSKRAAALYGSDDAIGPTHFIQAVGCLNFREASAADLRFQVAYSRP